MSVLNRESLSLIKEEEILLNSIDEFDEDKEMTFSVHTLVNHFKVPPELLMSFYNIDQMRKLIPVSMRKAMLLILEKKLTIHKKKREECEYEKIYKLGGKEYKYGNKKKSEYPTLDIIYPEDAHKEFEKLHPEDYKRQIKMLKKYRKDLLEILINKYWLINNDEVSQILYEVYDEINQSLIK